MIAAIEKIKRWREDPVIFVKEAFGVKPDLWQLEVLKNFADPKKQRIGMKGYKYE